jgi:hypothetical protein
VSPSETKCEPPPPNPPIQLQLALSVYWWMIRLVPVFAEHITEGEQHQYKTNSNQCQRKSKENRRNERNERDEIRTHPTTNWQRFDKTSTKLRQTSTTLRRNYNFLTSPTEFRQNFDITSTKLRQNFDKTSTKLRRNYVFRTTSTKLRQNFNFLTSPTEFRQNFDKTSTKLRQQSTQRLRNVGHAVMKCHSSFSHVRAFCFKKTICFVAGY